MLPFGKLRKAIENPDLYEAWRTALSSVNGVYLIVDRKSGRQYVGSASGQGGLWERWSEYVNTLHGGDQALKALLAKNPERHWQFQFSILQVLPKSASVKAVLDAERLYKDKLLTREYGLNEN